MTHLIVKKLIQNLEVKEKTNMSTAVLTGLLGSEQLGPYSTEEIDNMLDEAEAAFEAGDYLTNDEVFHHCEETVAL